MDEMSRGDYVVTLGAAKSLSPTLPRALTHTDFFTLKEIAGVGLIHATPDLRHLALGIFSYLPCPI